MSLLSKPQRSCSTDALGACGKTWLAVGEKLCCWCNCRCSRQAHPPCCCFQFEDGDFPPDATSIGAWKEKNASEVDAEIEWKRGNEICKLGDGEHMRLFSGKIEPADIGQGQLGDCWLMTSLACLSEFPGAIQNIFEDLEYSSRGRYTLRLYCGQKMQWETIEVDDRIPVKSGTTTPIFAKPHGEELWVALLEKAFAKFVGSYAKLDGGFAIWGLQAMTGDKVANWMLEDGVWKAYEIRYRQKKGDKGLKEGEMPDKVPVAACCGGKPPVDPKRADKNDVAFYAHREAGEDGGRPTHQTLSNDDFFEQLREWDEAECVIAASTSGKDEGEATAQMGLVQGHAYSVIEVITVEDGFTYKMLRVSPQPTPCSLCPGVFCTAVLRLRAGAQPVGRVRMVRRLVRRLAQVGAEPEGQEGLQSLGQEGGRRPLLDGVGGLPEALPEHRRLLPLARDCRRAPRHQRGRRLHRSREGVPRRLRGVLLLLQGRGAALLPDGPQGCRPAQAQAG